jgi:beta-glucosidase
MTLAGERAATSDRNTRPPLGAKSLEPKRTQLWCILFVVAADLVACGSGDVPDGGDPSPTSPATGATSAPTSDGSAGDVLPSVVDPVTTAVADPCAPSTVDSTTPTSGADLAATRSDATGTPASRAMRDGAASGTENGSASLGTEGTSGDSLSVGEQITPGFVYPAPVEAWRPSQTCIDKAAALLAVMTPRQKAGQMVQGDSDDIVPTDVATHEFGSVFSGGNADPACSNSPLAWRSHIAAYEAEAVGFGIPLLYGVDAVHGHNNVSDAVIFPHNIALGATRDPELVEEVGRITAREMRGTTADWTFAPAVSPARDERWGRTFESYSEDPGLTAEFGVAVVRGLQGESLGGPESVLACAKHFAGDGATEGGVDQGDTVLDETEFRTLGVEVYQPLINAGVGNIMVSFSSVNGVKMTANTYWLTDVLKNEMGFSGFLGSDWAATAQLPGGTAVQVATAINAGLDMLMEPYASREIAGILEAAPNASGDANIPQSRIDDAVARILAVKCELGMLEPGYDPAGDATLLADVGSEPHREVARRAVRQSAVLLENAAVLPLTPGAKIHVAGSGADSLQRQCGGWTVNWQGLGIVSSGETPGVTSGTTVLAGIRAATGEGNVTYSQDAGSIPLDAEVIVVVLSEAPYAEGPGDQRDLDLATQTPDVSVLEAARASGRPVVAVLISGRPLIIAPYLELADAWLAAWLPGTEANALADVLFGQQAPSGKLGHSWPRTMEQIPINLGDPDYETDPPLYPFGYGLSY